MNQYLNHHFAHARELGIRIRLDSVRVPDGWHPRSDRVLSDLVGHRLVQLGIRLLADRGLAERIEGHLRPRAA